MAPNHTVEDLANGDTSFVSGGTALFDTNPGAAQGSPFVEVQTVGGTSTTPEPVSEVLTLGGLAGLGLLARRKKKI
jgi:hypothetical protein